MTQGLKKLAAWVKTLTTEIDNQTPCFVRILALLAVPTGLGLAVYNVAQGNAFDFQNFGLGVGATFGGIAGALAFKKDTPLDGGAS